MTTRPIPAAALSVSGRNIPLNFRRNPRARRIILRMDRKGEGVIITLPSRASISEALRFAGAQADWIRARLTETSRGIAFAPGARIPLRGDLHEIIHLPQMRGTVWREEPSRICVAGEAAHLRRRVREYLKAEARADLRSASERYAALMNARFKRIVLRDPSGRWGSCTADGTLSYSWRLIFAPGFVLDYVAAHEVAHRIEMNHGPRFWALVRSHCPHVDRAKAWLSTDGANVHHYG